MTRPSPSESSASSSTARDASGCGSESMRTPAAAATAAALSAISTCSEAAAARRSGSRSKATTGPSRATRAASTPPMLPSPTTPTAGSRGMRAQSMLRRVSRRVFAVRYAHREARRAEHFYGPNPPDPHDAPMAMDYFLWAIVCDGPPVVVDAGFTPETARKRGREIVADPIAVLAALGVDAAEVRDVVLTHLHYDHSGYLAAFPRARFWVQDAELAFWTGRHAARRAIVHIVEPPDIVELVRLNFERRVRFVDGDEEMAPGISLHRVGGHAPGMQVVRVATAGGPIVLASDAAHFYANLELDRPYAVVHSLPGMYDAFDRVRALADGDDARIAPGHAPLVLERYAARAAALAGRAVEIAARR